MELKKGSQKALNPAREKGHKSKKKKKKIEINDVSALLGLGEISWGSAVERSFHYTSF